MSTDSGSTTSCQQPCQQTAFASKLDRLLAACRVKTDADLARALEIRPQSIASARRQQRIPFGWVEYVADKFSISSDWLLFGIGEMPRDSVAASPAEQEEPPKYKRRGLADSEEIPGSLSGEIAALREENRELRTENRELRLENRELIKENADLRVELAELKARAAPREEIQAEDTRKIA